MTRVVLGVTGGIAAYKAVEVCRLLTESGVDVTVVPTASALRFVGEPTWAALSGKAVVTDVWSNPESVHHVALGQQADLVLVAPATADFLARAAHGIASDLLTNVLLTASCPVLIAPAMHTEMWQHPATQANVRTLRERGAVVIEPASGRLTGADSGPGRLPDPVAIVDTAGAALRRVAHPGAVDVLDLRGKRVLISAGGTREPWDDVRYLGNRSSGRQGFALARTALARGAEVTVVAAAVEGSEPAGCTVLHVETAEQMRETMHASVDELLPDVVVMAAAVADFRPAGEHPGKISKDAIDEASPDRDARDSVPQLDLERTVDILAEITTKRGSSASPIVVGFAAEVPEPGESLAARALRKLDRKGCDFLVANEVRDGAIFGQSRTSVTVVGAHGSVLAEVDDVDKVEAAHLVWDVVLRASGRVAPASDAASLD
jgi:phosphopantothenoylcysteine decarboxylase/phosphopantothenate--cysteine ligase